MVLEDKDLVIISISSIALIISMVTFIFNFLQKRKDNLRALRKELTDVIKELVETTISLSKIEIEKNDLSNKIYELRRSFNQRRRYLIERAEFLMNDIPDYVTHVDLSSLAQACTASGLYEKANNFFIQLLEKTPLTVEFVFSMRGFARFLYQNDKVSMGREMYQDILFKIENDLLDISKNIKSREFIDTYLWYSRSEYNINNLTRAKELYLIAVDLEKEVNERPLKNDLAIILKENAYLKGFSNEPKSEK